MLTQFSYCVTVVVQFVRPKLLKQHGSNLEQYPLAPTFTANRSTLQPLFSITLFSGMSLLISVVPNLHVFFIWTGELYEDLSFYIFQLVPSRSLSKTQSDACCKIVLGDKFLFLTLVPFFTDFIFMSCFEVGTVDLMVLQKKSVLLMMILKTRP